MSLIKEDYERLKKAYQEKGISTYEIYQLKDDKRAQFPSMPYKQFKKKGFQIKPENYEPVYIGPVHEISELIGKTPTIVFRKLFFKFNSLYSADYKKLTLSLGDIVVLNLESKKMAFYIDKKIFKKIDDFTVNANNNKKEMEM